jgi:hypothetical protein
MGLARKPSWRALYMYQKCSVSCWSDHVFERVCDSFSTMGVRSAVFQVQASCSRRSLAHSEVGLQDHVVDRVCSCSPPVRFSARSPGPSHGDFPFHHRTACQANRFDDVEPSAGIKKSNRPDRNGVSQHPPPSSSLTFCTLATCISLHPTLFGTSIGLATEVLSQRLGRVHSRPLCHQELAGKRISLERSRGR